MNNVTLMVKRFFVAPSRWCPPQTTKSVDDGLVQTVLSLSSVLFCLTSRSEVTPGGHSGGYFALQQNFSISDMRYTGAVGKRVATPNFSQ